MLTQLSDVIVPDFYAAYGGIDTMTSTALYQSGVLVDSPILTSQLPMGGDIVNLPAWLDLAAANDPGGVEPNLGNDKPHSSPPPGEAGQDLRHFRNFRKPQAAPPGTLLSALL